MKVADPCCEGLQLCWLNKLSLTVSSFCCTSIWGKIVLPACQIIKSTLLRRWKRKKKSFCLDKAYKGSRITCLLAKQGFSGLIRKINIGILAFSFHLKAHFWSLLHHLKARIETYSKEIQEKTRVLPIRRRKLFLEIDAFWTHGTEETVITGLDLDQIIANIICIRCLLWSGTLPSAVCLLIYLVS